MIVLSFSFDLPSTPDRWLRLDIVYPRAHQIHWLFMRVITVRATPNSAN